jgi:hypothetical protein
VLLLALKSLSLVHAGMTCTKRTRPEARFLSLAGQISC